MEKQHQAQSRILRIITGAPCYLQNENIHRDLQIKLVIEAIAEKIVKYNEKLASHPNPLAKKLIRVCSQSRLHQND